MSEDLRALIAPIRVGLEEERVRVAAIADDPFAEAKRRGCTISELSEELRRDAMVQRVAGLVLLSEADAA